MHACETICACLSVQMCVPVRAGPVRAGPVRAGPFRAVSCLAVLRCACPVRDIRAACAMRGMRVCMYGCMYCCDNYTWTYVGMRVRMHVLMYLAWTYVGMYMQMHARMLGVKQTLGFIALVYVSTPLPTCSNLKQLRHHDLTDACVYVGRQSSFVRLPIIAISISMEPLSVIHDCIKHDHSSC